MWLNYLLTKSGVDSSDVTFVGLGTAGIAAALQKGEIHAGIGIEPHTTRLLEAGDAFILVDGRSLEDTIEVFGAPYILIGLVTNPRVVEENPELCQRMVNAIVRANLWTATTPAEVMADLFPDFITGTGEEKETWIKALKAYKTGGVYPANSGITYEGARTVVESLVPFVEELESADQIDIVRTYNNSFVQKALEKYGLALHE